VSFVPTTAGALTGTLTINSDAASNPDVVSLSGTAVDPGSNLLQNGSFEVDSDGDGIPDSWTASNLKGDGRVCETAAEGACSVHLAGHGSNQIKQKVNLTGEAGESHTLTLWAMGSNLGGSGHSYRVQVIVTHNDGTQEIYEIAIPAGTSPWTQYTLSFITQGSYKQILVQVVGGKATGEIWLDDFILQ